MRNSRTVSYTHLDVYKRQATDQLQFVTNANVMNAPVEVFDLAGRRVISTTLTSDRLDVSDLTSGVYVLRLQLKGRTEQLRFTKE